VVGSSQGHFGLWLDENFNIKRKIKMFFCVQVYGWTGENNYIVRGGTSSLVVGSSQGHFGLWLDENFNMGRSMAVSTFRSGIYCYFSVLRIHDNLCGSGSADPCLSPTDPDSDPDPANFIIDLKDANKKLTKIKSQKEVAKQ
jgi:hypothetical protein